MVIDHFGTATCTTVKILDIVGKSWIMNILLRTQSTWECFKWMNSYEKDFWIYYQLQIWFHFSNIYFQNQNQNQRIIYSNIAKNHKYKNMWYKLKTLPPKFQM